MYLYLNSHQIADCLPKSRVRQKTGSVLQERVWVLILTFNISKNFYCFWYPKSFCKLVHIDTTVLIYNLGARKWKWPPMTAKLVLFLNKTRQAINIIKNRIFKKASDFLGNKSYYLKGIFFLFCKNKKSMLYSVIRAKKRNCYKAGKWWMQKMPCL